MKVTNKAIATLIDAMGMKSCNDERIENGLSAAYPDSAFTASAQNILDESIDWEERRYELAKAAMQGIISNPVTFELMQKPKHIGTNEMISLNAVDVADELIKRLKGGIVSRWNEFEEWHECKDDDENPPEIGADCILRLVYSHDGKECVEYVTSVWNNFGWTQDYLESFEYYEDYRVTHWKPIIKPKGV